MAWNIGTIESTRSRSLIPREDPAVIAIECEHAARCGLVAGYLQASCPQRMRQQLAGIDEDLDAGRLRFQPEAVDAYVAHEMAQGIEHQRAKRHIAEIERIAAAGIVDQRTIGCMRIGAVI